MLEVNTLLIFLHTTQDWILIAILYSYLVKVQVILEVLSNPGVGDIVGIWQPILSHGWEILHLDLSNPLYSPTLLGVGGAWNLQVHNSHPQLQNST